MKVVPQRATKDNMRAYQNTLKFPLVFLSFCAVTYNFKLLICGCWFSVGCSNTTHHVFLSKEAEGNSTARLLKLYLSYNCVIIKAANSQGLPLLTS